MNLSAQEVRALLQRAVDEKGADYVYPDEERISDLDDVLDGTCAYFRKDGAPSCIVGHVLYYAGVTEAREGAGAFGAAKAITDDCHILDALSVAQGIQDNGGTWGEALAAFDEYMESHVE